MMFTKIVITHKSGNSKAIDIEEYGVRELNAIVAFYEEHKDYEVENV